MMCWADTCESQSVDRRREPHGRPETGFPLAAIADRAKRRRRNHEIRAAAAVRQFSLINPVN